MEFLHSCGRAAEQQPRPAKLVKVKLSDLRLNNPCSFQDVCDRASNLGFLRLEYLDQPEGPYLTIASPQSENDENYPTGFYIRNFENSQWLRGYRAIGVAEWPMDNEFTFLK